MTVSTLYAAKPAMGSRDLGIAPMSQLNPLNLRMTPWVEKNESRDSPWERGCMVVFDMNSIDIALDARATTSPTLSS